MDKLYYNPNEEKKLNELLKVSNPKQVILNAHKYLGNNIRVNISTHKNKKYMIWNGNKFIHFGDIRYEDFTKSNNLEKREAYLKRTANIRGSWKNDLYSANNLARVILWDAPF
jgi:hypothetical protein